MTDYQKFLITLLFVDVAALGLLVRYLYKKVKALEGDAGRLYKHNEELKKRLENVESVLQIVQENKP